MRQSEGSPRRPAERKSLEPVRGADRAFRRRLSLRGELLLALLPTATVLLVLALVEVLSEQRLLFASLASSAFLIYLDPQHGTNSVRTLALSQTLAAGVGWVTYATLGATYASGGLAMVAVIVLMIVLDAVHPPAVATALSFALRAGDASNVLLFGLAVGITAVLVALQRVAVWTLAWATRREARAHDSRAQARAAGPDAAASVGFPQPLVTFARLFNGGAYWESHEALEGAWRETRSDFYKGLILLASAYVHVGRGNLRGVTAQLRKAERHLAPYPPAYAGVDVATLVDHARRSAAAVDEVSRRPGSPPPDLDALVPQVTIALDGERVRGDEPELAGG